MTKKTAEMLHYDAEHGLEHGKRKIIHLKKMYYVYVAAESRTDSGHQIYFNRILNYVGFVNLNKQNSNIFFSSSFALSRLDFTEQILLRYKEAIYKNQPGKMVKL